MSSAMTSALLTMVLTPRRVQMQYGGYDAQRGVQQDYSSQLVWSLSGFSGVQGFSGVEGTHDRALSLAADTAASGSAGSIYQQDYRNLPYILRNGQGQVLSRWNMVSQKLTVSRMQCEVQVSADGTATLISRGKGPTLWRAWGGPWNGLNKGEWQELADCDQVTLPARSVHTSLPVATPCPYRPIPYTGELGLARP